MEQHLEDSSRTLSTEGLAREAGTTSDYVRRLIDAGAIPTGPDGTHEVRSIARVRLALALTGGGIDVDDLVALIRSGRLALDWVAGLWDVGQPSGRTYGDFAGSLGDRAGQLPSIYAAFGLAVPSPETVMRRDEEDTIVGFIDLWSMIDDRPESFLRAARIAGEGVRRIQGGTLDLFDELGGPPTTQLERGKSGEDALRPAMHLSPVTANLLVWLQKRHQENEVFGRIATYVDDLLAGSGRVDRRSEPPAIAFVDLSGYTQLTVESGDMRAAEFATTLQALAESAARAHRGQVVKLLGDGVMLRYATGLDAVRSVAGLMAAVLVGELPAAHAGIAAGPLVVRDGDVYGHTVNLAARIASEAHAGEVLVEVALAHRLEDVGIGCIEAGDHRLKGIYDPVPLARVDLHTV